MTHSPPPGARRANRTVDDTKRGIARIQKRIADLDAFDPNSILKRWGPEAKALETAIDETLAAVFGYQTVEYNRYRRAANLDHGPLNARQRASLEEARRYVAEGKREAITLLRQAIRGLDEEIADMEAAAQLAPPEPGNSLTSRDLSQVFVVHGHDEAAREAIARFIEKLGFTAIILHERPNKGRTIITKFREEAAGVGFAVVLMTPDDVGGVPGLVVGKLRHRARQNVVFELGFFIGALGSDRVAALVKGDVERPSDFDGVVYISLDKDDWRAPLARELEAAGYEIDWNKVMKA